MLQCVSRGWHVCENERGLKEKTLSKQDREVGANPAVHFNRFKNGDDKWLKNAR